VDDETLRALKALADPTRLRVLGLLAERPWTPADLADAIRRGRAPLGLPALARHLDVLRAACLLRDVTTPGGPAVALRVERLGELGRALDALEPNAAVGPPLLDTAGRPLPPEDAKVLRAFVVDDRLASIPVAPRKRDVILRWLLERCFPEDRPYPEKEVNARLAVHHPDVASLRRHLVDEGHLARAGGVYRRTAPPVAAGDAPSAPPSAPPDLA
jgi:DNA-binding transcriptional ArsR family regulator